MERTTTRNRRLLKGGLPTLGAAIFAAAAFLVSGGIAHASPQYTITCSTCHQMPPLDSGTASKRATDGAIPGNHQTHAGSAVASCAKCHGGAVNGYGTSHRNKAIELSGVGYSRGFINQTSVPPTTLGTCATAACHFGSATPAWGSAAFSAPADCGQCHGVAPSTGSHPTTGTKHAAYFGTGTGSCVKCHSNHLAEGKPFAHATSAGRAIDVRFATAPNTGGTFTSPQCLNLYCHSDGNGTGVNVTPTWGGSLNCIGCHNSDVASGAPMSTGKHGAHVNGATAAIGTNYGCVECHAGTVSDNATIIDVNLHVNGAKNVSGAKVGTPVAGNCNAAYCHSNGKGTFVPVTWNQGTGLVCNGCHGSGTSIAGEPTYTSEAAGTLMANSHGKHVTAASDCIKCHSATVDATGALIAGTSHTNQSIDVQNGPGITFSPGAGKTCSNISCHSGGGIITGVAAATWGDTLSCTGCHSTLSASHAKHTSVYGCVDCHDGSVIDNSTIKKPGLHMNSERNVSGTRITSVNLTQHTCATACHLSSTPNWTNASTGACGSCHDATSPTIRSNAHKVHFNISSAQGPGIARTVVGCQVCHAYSGETTHVSGSGVVGMNGGYSKIGTCSTCHTRGTTNWTSAVTVTCESCHTTTGGALSQISGLTAPNKTLAATKGHGALSQACTSCHDSSARHITGTLGDDTRLLSDLGTGNTNCTFCHSNATTVPTPGKQITQVHVGFANACSVCHDPHGTGNDLMVNTTLNGVTVSYTAGQFVNVSGTGVCQACHTNTSYYKQNVNDTSHNPGSNCLECHPHKGFDGITAFEPNRQCDSCHGYPPAPRNVNFAVTFGVQNNWSSARFEDYSGGGGAHVLAAHIAKTVKPADQFEPCKICHFDAAASHNKAMPLRNHVDNVTVKVDPQYRFADTFIVYTSAKLVNGGLNKTGSCFNVSCHIAPSPKWSIER